MKTGKISLCPTLTIVQAETGKNLELARNFFKEYAASLEFDLDFQDFEEEFSTLPGQYASPAGRLLVAMYGEKPARCIGLRKISHGICEMKRLYVSLGFKKITPYRYNPIPGSEFMELSLD